MASDCVTRSSPPCGQDTGPTAGTRELPPGLPSGTTMLHPGVQAVLGPEREHLCGTTLEGVFLKGLFTRGRTPGAEPSPRRRGPAATPGPWGEQKATDGSQEGEGRACRHQGSGRGGGGGGGGGGTPPPPPPPAIWEEVSTAVWR